MGNLLEQIQAHRNRKGWIIDIRYKSMNGSELTPVRRSTGSGGYYIRQTIIGRDKNFDLDAAIISLNKLAEPEGRHFTVRLSGVAGIVMIMAAAAINHQSNFGIALSTKNYPFSCSGLIGTSVQLQTELDLRTYDCNPHGFPSLTLQ